MNDYLKLAAILGIFLLGSASDTYANPYGQGNSTSNQIGNTTHTRGYLHTGRSFNGSSTRIGNTSYGRIRTNTGQTYRTTTTHQGNHSYTRVR